MDFSTRLHGLQAALAAFVDSAQRAGLDAPTVTAPEWTVRELTAHLGMVHRWSQATLAGHRTDPAAYEAEGLAEEDPVRWLHDGGLALLEALRTAPEDLQAFTFLHDPPSPRDFWARRQCHETTMHAVDALSAVLGRSPRAEETWIERNLALDGIDELLTGFLPRPQSRLRRRPPVSVAVRPDDAEEGWLVHLSDEVPVSERNRHGDADHVLEAPAVALYLALWNRSDEVAYEELGFWREGAQVRWGSR